MNKEAKLIRILLVVCCIPVIGLYVAYAVLASFKWSNIDLYASYSVAWIIEVSSSTSSKSTKTTARTEKKTRKEHGHAI